MIRNCLILCLALLLLSPVNAWAQADEQDADMSKAASGLPLPRFASLKTNEVNLRTGPGTRYPIEWVLTKKGLPIEIIAEYEIWRQIRTPDGDEGWVHKSALSGKRGCIVTGATHDLHEEENPLSPVIAKVESGALCQIVSCNQGACEVKFDEIKGYLQKSSFWGAYQKEILK